MCLLTKISVYTYESSIISTPQQHIASFKLLIKQCAIIGIASSTAIGIVAFYSQQYVLFFFASAFILICSSSYYLATINWVKSAIHVILNGCIIGFTLSPFCGLHFLSGILIYPLIISLATFFLSNPLERFIYAIVSAIGCIIFIYKAKVANFDTLEYHLLEESLIVFGLLSSLFIVGYNYFVVVFRYQAKLEESRALLHTKNQELENYIDSNLQLENFAHLASHELKTPLRNILNFSKLLSKEIGTSISNQKREMLGIIENQASEMDELIRDLFELSSVTNEPMKTDRVELNKILSNLIKFDFVENKSSIKVKKIPNEIFANKSYIKEVFKNLISNALKFISPDKDAEIIIDCEESIREYQFSIKDNGIGIKEEKREKVFLIFKRLHTRKDYEGTGIGLAICKKIVERHLGKIWIEENPEGGSIFKFTIAKNLA